VLSGLVWLWLFKVVKIFWGVVNKPRKVWIFCAIRDLFLEMR
jgi:hypothetical protein